MYRMSRADRSLAYSIAGAAGFVDASGFLAADRYFVSFMSGNTTRLGVELARGSSAAAMAGMLLAGFVVGVALGALVADRLEPWRKTSVLIAATMLLLAAATAQAFGLTLGLLLGAVLAMGAINNVFRKSGEVALGVTYMTGALVRVGEGLAGLIKPSAQRRRGAFESLLLWASLSGGGCVGALVYLNFQPAAGWLGALWVLALALFACRIEARESAQPN